MYPLPITVHALAALVALVTGLVAVPRGRWIRLHRAALVVMVGALVPALIIGWSSIDPLLRIVFLGLLGLAAVTAVRAHRAVLQRPLGTVGPSHGYLDHLGFTTIALLNGFAIIAILRAGGPAWLAIGTALAIIAAGHWAIRFSQRRLVRESEPVDVVAR